MTPLTPAIMCALLALLVWPGWSQRRKGCAFLLMGIAMHYDLAGWVREMVGS